MNRRLNDGSRMSGDVHVRFCEGLGVKFPRSTLRLEFQLFKDLPRVDVIDSAGGALSCLESLNANLDDRIKTLAANRVKDFPAFVAIEKQKRIYPEGVSPGALLGRRVIVIDEVAELFLAGGAVNAEQSKRASEIVSRISRLGRAPGIHLVLGTQRPDKRALDTQIKANLPGKLCFQMADTASSVSFRQACVILPLPS